MNGNGAIIRQQATITVQQLRDHLKGLNDDTKIVIELPDGRRMNLKAVSDPKATDVPFVIIAAADDYSLTSLGF